MIDRTNRIARTARRIATLAGLSGLVLAAGTDWAAAATFAEPGGAPYSGPENAEIFAIVLFAAGFALLAALIRHGRPEKSAVRRPLRNR